MSTKNLNDVQETALAWEKMRWAYNGIMLLIGLPSAAAVFFFSVMAGQGSAMAALEALALVGAGALSYGIVANVCYFAGPVVELYMSRVFDKQLGTKGRYALFGAGLAFSMAVTMGVVAYTGVYGVVGLFG